MEELRLRFKGTLQADLRLRPSPEQMRCSLRRESFGTSVCFSGQTEAWAFRAINHAKFRTFSALLFGGRAVVGISLPSPKQGQAIVDIAVESIHQGVRNVAILDYYLKHVDDEEQLRAWTAGWPRRS